MYIYDIYIYLEYFSIASISDIINNLEVLKQSLFFTPPTHLSFCVCHSLTLSLEISILYVAAHSWSLDPFPVSAI